ncbi:esterase/lipase [Cordyceps fumosorosea ARSEF 2679]|uniref:Esterase/lipase n=1 Tax=Cordyceps fumosorosea (strain ARSEF 2679) TaxID=1081104 RepID=A0A166VUU3_CORFA|nr:esterase/lipase [Cordyceps fumosorosea ARSEF 2679]OAA34052.1 esterase/lipase [Cordyceps fumosorosea ARSEF 2679]
MGLTLDAEFASAIAPIRASFANLPKAAIHDVQARRHNLAVLADNGLPPPIPAGVKQDMLSVTAKDGYNIPLWQIARKFDTSPVEKNPKPAVLYMHGGGFIALDVESSARELYALVLASGVTIYAVDYRLAPEHQYPTPLEDCWACLQYIHDNAAALCVDLACIAVMGDSAGGNLAAGVTLLARDRGLMPPIARQILVYPMLDDRNKETMNPGALLLWNEEDNLTGWTAYLGAHVGGDKVPIYAAPGRLTDATGLPPLYLYVGQLDLFAKENVHYVSLFIEAGIDAELHLIPGLPHGFNGLAKDHAATKDLFDHRVKYLKSLAHN